MSTTIRQRCGYKIRREIDNLKNLNSWVPEPYGYDENDRFSETRLREDLDREVLEKRMPDDLKQHILNQTRRLDPRNLNFDSTRKMLLSTVHKIDAFLFTTVYHFNEFIGMDQLRW